MVRIIVAITIILLLILMGPIFGWPLIHSSTDIGMLCGIGLLVLSRPRLAWTIVLIAAIVDASRSVLPAFVLLLAASAGMAAAQLANRRLLSGHSQSQVAVLVVIALAAVRLIFILMRSLEVVTGSTWYTPTTADLLNSLLSTGVWAVAVTLLFWPTISRRWLPLQRISYWS